VFFPLIFIGVELLYNVVSVFAVQQSESAIHTHISPLYRNLYKNHCVIDMYMVLCIK